jgi:LCP family protein required for cell wall assembly
MSRIERLVIIFWLGILALLGIVVALVFWQAAQFWRTPLGPGLELSTQTAILSRPPATLTPFIAVEEASASPQPMLSPQPADSPSPTASPTPLPTLTPIPSPTTAPEISESLCGGPAVMTLLAVGSDARSDSYQYGLADVIRIIRVDFATPKVSILEFPRDLWVEIPEIVDNIGVENEKLNQAYLYGNPGFGYYDGPGAGPGLLARTLDMNFGVHPDHYLAVNMQTFVKIVNAVGGVDVTLPYTIDHRFKAGHMHLDGQLALTLARNRIEGVFERGGYQNLVLCALRDKLLNPAVLPQIPEIIASFQGSVQTDLTPEQISQLACLGTQLDTGYLIFASFPEELFKGTRTYDPVFKKNLFIWNVDFNMLRDYVSRFSAGTWPVGPSESASPYDIGSFCP